MFEKDRLAFGNNQYLVLVCSLSQLRTGEEKVLLVLLSVHQSGGRQLLYLALSFQSLMRSSDKTEFWMLWPLKGVTYVITHNTRDLY